MRKTAPISGWRATALRVMWLPLSLLLGAITLASMSVLDYVFEKKRRIRREEGMLWGLLSISYWVLGAVFTGEWHR